MAKKIFELSGEAWAKGFSFHNSIQVGGVFNLASSFDPFNQLGTMTPSRNATLYGAGTISKTIRWMEGLQLSGTEYLLSYADGALYKTTISNGTTVDISSLISVTGNAARGAKVFNGYFYYAKAAEIRKWDLNVTDASVLTSGMVSGEHPLVIGADRNLYFPNGKYIGKVATSGIGSDTATAFSLEDDMIVRHLVNDGRYLVIIADNNGGNSGGSAGKHNCMVAYWDMTSGSLAQRFDFQEYGLIGGALLDGIVYVFGRNNLYITNIATAPKAIWSFMGNSTITSTPNSPSCIDTNGNSIYWGAVNGRMYAYGSLSSGQKKVMYSPYFGSNTGTSAIKFTGQYPWMADSQTNGITGFLTATNATASIRTSQVTLPQPYKFSFAKIVLRAPMSSGQEFDIELDSTLLSTPILVNKQIFYSSPDVGAKKTFIVKNSGGGTEVESFDEFFVQIATNAAVNKVEIWGEPLDPQRQTD